MLQMAEDKKPASLEYSRPDPSDGAHPVLRQFFALLCAVIAALFGLPAVVYSISIFRHAWAGPSADFSLDVQGGLCFLIPGLVCIFMAWRWGRSGFRGH